MIRKISLALLFASTLILFATTSAQAGPNVNPNHIMWILDETSFDLLANNDFLIDQFSSFNKKTITSGPDTWTAVYLTGEKTHIEFMSANPKFPQGTIGVALSVEEQVGDINAIESQLRSEWGSEVVRDQRTLPWKDTIIPWFDYAILRLGGGNFRTWVMEYDSKYLERTRPDRPQDWGITREGYKRPTYLPERLLKNITGVRLKLDPLLLEQEKKTLLALEYKEETEGHSVVLSRPDFVVKLDKGEEGKFEISEIEMELNQVYTDQTEVNLTEDLKLIFDQKLPRAVLKRGAKKSEE